MTERKIRKLIDLCIKINGMSSRCRELTGDLPAVMFYFYGHVGLFEIHAYRRGYGSDEEPEWFSIHTEPERFEKREYRRALGFLLELKRAVWKESEAEPIENGSAREWGFAGSCDGNGEGPRESGWAEIRTGTFVSDEDAFDYALENCFETVPAGVRLLKWTREFREMLVGWFYSGNWVKQNEGMSGHGPRENW